MAIVAKGEVVLSELNVEQLTKLLKSRKFQQSYFYGGKHASDLDRRVRETEEELRKRGALS